MNMSNFKLSSRSLERLDGVHPDVLLIVTESIKVTPIDFGIPKDGGYRTSARQAEMFADPNIKTKCDGVTKLSKHQSGKAWDFYAYVGTASWDMTQLGILYGVFNTVATRLLEEGKISHKLVWGGTFGSTNFNGWDGGHAELKEV